MSKMKGRSRSIVDSTIKRSELLTLCKAYPLVVVADSEEQILLLCECFLVDRSRVFRIGSGFDVGHLAGHPVLVLPRLYAPTASTHRTYIESRLDTLGVRTIEFTGALEDRLSHVPTP